MKEKDLTSYYWYDDIYDDYIDVVIDRDLLVEWEVEEEY